MIRNRLNYLENWIKSSTRKPLIVRGARQVGKSTLVRDFAKNNNLNLHEVNLEQHKQLKTALASNDADQIFQEFQLIVNKGNINTAGSLLFIDEIQAIPEALEALRYMFEKAPELPIIAAGSLLEFTLGDHEYSMPVGRVEYMFMGPLTFEEFVEAAGEVSLLSYLKSFQLRAGQFSGVAHDKLLELYRLFCVIGGMPEAVDIYFRTKDFSATRKIQASIVTTYRDDFAKYAKGSGLLRLHKVLDHVSVSLGEKIKYSNIDPDSKSAELKKAIFLLNRAQVVELAFHSSASMYPLRAQADFNTFKPYYLDAGLISYMLAADTSLGQVKEQAHQGKLAEQFIAQHLLSFSDPMSRPELYYWLREAKRSNAEVDFIISLNGQLLPVEVKSGKAGSLKSLHQFVAQRESKLAIRFSQSIPVLENVKYQLTDKSTQGSFKLLSLPFYLVGQMDRLAAEVELIPLRPRAFPAA